MQLYGPTSIVTKDGECKITLALELNINVNSTGALTVSGTPIIAQQLSPKEEEVEWVIPDFTNERIHFGKKVEE